MTADAQRNRFRLWMLLPALLAFILMTVFFRSLGREDQEDLPSALIDRPVPQFELPGLGDRPGMSTADLKGGGVKLVNVWASWCVPCRAEHPWLTALAEDGVTIHGLNYKDKAADAEAFLDELGDPYSRVGSDTSGRVGIEWGVYGVPETFVVDDSGTIVYKHVGPITAGDVSNKIRPAMERARASD